MRSPRIIIVWIGLFRMLSYLFKEYKINNSLHSLNTFGRYWHISFHNTESHSPVCLEILKCINGLISKILFAVVVQSLSCVQFFETPGLQHTRLPFLHYLPEFVQTQVHWVSDAIQPSHPLLTPSPPAFNLSQHQGLFQGVSSSYQVAKVLELQLQHQSFQWIFWVDILRIDWFDLFAVQGILKSLLQHQVLWKLVCIQKLYRTNVE